MKEFNLFDTSESQLQAVEKLTSLQDEANLNMAQQIYNPIARRREAEEKSLQVYATYQNATIRAGQLRSDITKGIQEGEDAYHLLLKAIECISLMTGDELYYEQNKEGLTVIYGIGLLEATPLNLELECVRKRLQMLKRAELRNESESNRERLKQSIKKHEQREIHLQKLMQANQSDKK